LISHWNGETRRLTQTYIIDVQPDPKRAYYPVKDFPILAKLLAERYQPVAQAAEGVIYRMR